MSLKGKKVVFTGTMSQTRAKMKKEAEAAGIDVDSAVSANTDLLVCGTGVISKGTNGKFKDAVKHGVDYIDEDEYRKRLTGKKSTKKSTAKSKPSKSAKSKTTSPIEIALGALTVSMLKGKCHSLGVSYKSSTKKTALIKSLVSLDTKEILNTFSENEALRASKKFGIDPSLESLFTHLGVEYTTDSLITEEMVQHFFEHTLQIPYDTPSLIAFERLKTYIQAHKTNDNVNQSIKSLLHAGIKSRTFLQLLGELIRDAHAAHPVIEGEDIIDFGLDPNYTYNDECFIGTICRVRIALTSDLYMSDDDLGYPDEDEGWSEKGCAYMESFIEEAAPELLNYVYGEDSFYDESPDMVPFFGTEKLKSDGATEFGNVVGLKMTELFNRPKTSLIDWIDAQHDFSKTERRAMTSLLQKDLEDDAWCAKYIPKHPRFVDIFYPIQSNGLRESSPWNPLSYWRIIEVTSYLPNNAATQRKGWLAQSHTISLDNIKFVDAVETENYTEFFGYQADESGYFFRSEYPELFDKLAKVLQAGHDICNNKQTSATVIWVNEDTGEEEDHNLSNILKLAPNVTDLLVSSRVSTLVRAQSTTLERLHIEYMNEDSTWDNILGMCTFLESCPNLQFISGGLHRNYQPPLESRIDVEFEAQLNRSLHEWMTHKNFNKVRALFEGDTTFLKQGIELWLSLREHSLEEIRLMNDMMYGLENNLNLGYEQGNYLASYLAGSSKSTTHISYDYGEDTPEHYDLSGESHITDIELAVQPALKTLNVTGLTNLKTLTIDAANYLEKIIGLETCTSLERLFIGDSSLVGEGQNERHGYFMDGSQFELDLFDWKTLSRQIEQLVNLRYLGVESNVADIKCTLPSKLEKVSVTICSNFDVDWPDSIQDVELYLKGYQNFNPDINELLSLPNIHRISCNLDDVEITVDDSTVEELELMGGDISGIDNIAQYDNLRELYLQTTISKDDWKAFNNTKLEYFGLTNPFILLHKDQIQTFLDNL